MLKDKRIEKFLTISQQIVSVYYKKKRTKCSKGRQRTQF